MRNKKIILIGGAAGTGKTTLAKKLSLEMGVPWISTDQIQAVVKSAMGETWIEFGEGLSAEEVFQKEIERCEIVWRGVLAFIKHLYPWDACVIGDFASFG
jgi:adenylate kinase family enzyme